MLGGRTCAQRQFELTNDAAASMALLLESMRGKGAVGTTALECRSLAPATLLNIIEVC